jgi:hypothetical protein
MTGASEIIGPHSVTRVSVEGKNMYHVNLEGCNSFIAAMRCGDKVLKHNVWFILFFSLALLSDSACNNFQERSGIMAAPLHLPEVESHYQFSTPRAQGWGEDISSEERFPLLVLGR